MVFGFNIRMWFAYHYYTVCQWLTNRYSTGFQQSNDINLMITVLHDLNKKISHNPSPSSYLVWKWSVGKTWMIEKLFCTNKTQRVKTVVANCEKSSFWNYQCKIWHTYISKRPKQLTWPHWSCIIKYFFVHNFVSCSLDC